MPLKTQLDKAAWEWIDSTKPEDVDNSHVKTAYRVTIPACKPGSCRRNCKGNPQCLECLGEKEWFTEIADENWHVIDDPNTDRRPENSCVGLKNLGATCYVNSLLQLWYHNPTFRKAIYEWRQLDDASNNLAAEKVVDVNDENSGSATLIGQLQYIFALLQFSCRRYIDPSSFIKSLGLNTAQQQDAQEFSKLFLARLEDELQHQDNPLVKNIVQEQFSGDYSYVTRCSQCGTESARPSQFYELQLNIKGHKELGECIDEFLQDEKLEGENQYSCGNCGSLQDAVQKIKLHRLPPVLNLQLLRFIFDRETTRKRKINAAIKFPEVLDMSKYVGTTAGNKDAYNLAAVLIHRGPSAYSGHYVALVRNHLSGEWFQFNDETVKKLDGKVLQLSAEDDAECEGTNKTPRNSKVTKGFHETKNAYMLVYTRDNGSSTDVSENDSDDWKLSGELRNAITKDNKKFEEWVAEMTSMREQNVESGKAKQDEVKQIYEMMHQLEEDNWDFVPTAWITKWLRDNSAVAAINNTNMLCSHQRLLPDNAIKMKRISSKAADILYEKYGGGPRLGRESLCKDCIVQRCQNMRLKNQLSQDTKLIMSMARHKISDTDSAYWVGRMSMRRWRILVMKLLPGADDGMEATGSGTDEIENSNGGNETGNGHGGDEGCDENGDCGGEEGPLSSFNDDIVCAHRNLNIKENSRRLVPETVWQRLTYYFPSAPTFNRAVEPCPICQKQVAGDQEAKDAQKALALYQRNLLCDIYHDRHRPHLFHQDSPVFYVVSTEFIQDLRRYLREPQRRPPVTQVNNSKLVCSHGGLLYPLVNSADADSKLSLVTDGEWTTIGQLFSVDTTIKVVWSRPCETGPMLADTEPGLCLDCHTELVREEERQLLEYESARIYICKVSPKETIEGQSPAEAMEDGGQGCDDDQAPVNKRRRSELVDGFVSTIVSPPVDTKRVRRSQRHRKGRDEKTINVSSKQTLRDLKVQIMQLFSVAPYDQHLSIEGRNLTDGGATLADLRVLPGSVIYLQADEPNEEALDFNDDYMPSGTPEEGFKGTELLRS